MEGHQRIYPPLGLSACNVWNAAVLPKELWFKHSEGKKATVSSGSSERTDAQIVKGRLDRQKGDLGNKKKELIPWINENLIVHFYWYNRVVLHLETPAARFYERVEPKGQSQPHGNSPPLLWLWYTHIPWWPSRFCSLNAQKKRCLVFFFLMT